MDREAWWAAVHGVAESDTIEHTQSPAKLQVHGSFKCSLDKLCDNLVAEGGEG